MRVLIVHNDYGKFSGEEAVVQGDIELLESRGHEVLRFSRSSAEISGMRFGQVRAFLAGVYSASSAGQMKRVLREKRPDVVHIHNLFPLISPSILGACRRQGTPVVMTVHNFRLVCPTGLLLSHGEICERCLGGREYWCILRNCPGSCAKSIGYALRNFVARRWRFYLDNVTVFATLTDYHRRRLVAEGFPEDRFVKLPNFVKSSTASCHPSLGDFVGYVGRISPEKGIPVLMEAARRMGNVPFRAAGAYDSMPGLLAEAPGNFEFLGHLGPEQLRTFYASSRIVTLSSLCYETFPMSLIEAMIHEKPVICPRLAGLPEIVDDGVTGLLFAAGDAADLARKIAYLWDRPELCRQLGQAGRQKALREYSETRHYELLLAVYQKAMALVHRREGRQTGRAPPISTAAAGCSPSSQQTRS